MNRRNLYERLPNELLGSFYCYILKKIEQGVNLHLLHDECRLIEKAAKKRGMSLIELRIIGYWFIQKEVNLTKEEEKRKD